MARLRKEFACADGTQGLFHPRGIISPPAYSGPKNSTTEVLKISRQAKFEYLVVDPLTPMATPLGTLFESTVLEFAKSIKHC